MRSLERTLDQRGNVPVLKVFEFHNTTTRKQCRVDLEVRILRRSANHNNGTVLNCMQQSILLRLREAVNLIDE